MNLRKLHKYVTFVCSTLLLMKHYDVLKFL